MNNRSWINEAMIESYTARFPERVLGETLELIGQQMQLGGRRPDLVFGDARKRVVIVELRNGPLDGKYVDRSLEYRTAAAEYFPDSHIRVVLVGTQVREPDRNRMRQSGIEYSILTPALLREIAEFHQRAGTRQYLGPPVAHNVHEPLEMAAYHGTGRVQGSEHWLCGNDVLNLLSAPRDPADFAEHHANGRDGMVFWRRGWPDPVCDYLVLGMLNLYRLECAGNLIADDPAGPPRIRDADGLYQRIPGIPVQYVVAAAPLLRMSVAQAVAAYLLLEYLQQHCTPPCTSVTVQLAGHRARKGRATAAGEEALRALHARFAAGYRTDHGFDREILAQDMAVLHQLALLSGPAHGLKELAIAGSVQLTGGSQGIGVRLHRINAGYLATMHGLLEHLLGHHVAAVPGATTPPSLGTIVEHWMAGPAARTSRLLAAPLDLQSGCPVCLRRPRRLRDIPTQALALADLYFAHLAPTS